jgi:hypothetical protein
VRILIIRDTTGAAIGVKRNLPGAADGTQIFTGANRANGDEQEDF